MANLFDYLKWRGDLPLDQTPLNDIDGLILSRLSYLPFDGIVSDSFAETITIAQASDGFFRTEGATDNVIMRADLPLLSELAANARYAQLKLCGYVNDVDAQAEKQFAALVIRLTPDLVYISYRGTDLTLAGWKEDFNMSFGSPVPSQTESVHYLRDVAANFQGEFILGGHSKGGNLAVYAAAFAEPPIQERILSILNHDGPGFDSSVLSSAGYRKIAAKIKTYIPQSSVVGMLLQHEEDYSVVSSSQIGLMQHDPFSWDVERDSFVYLDRVDGYSHFVDQTLKSWVANLNTNEREQFINTLFAIFEETNAKTLKELTNNWHTSAKILLRSYLDLEPEMRQNITHILSLLLAAAKKNLPLYLPLAKSRNVGREKENKTP